nr:CorA family divalent cation transporter [Candidatus Sigynarchaeota archaeon]
MVEERTIMVDNSTSTVPPVKDACIAHPKGKAIITKTLYNESDYFETVVDITDSAALLDSSYKGVTWIDVDGVEDVETVQKIGQVFNLHPIVVEDIIDVEQRPKIVEQDDYIFIEFNVFYKGKEKFEVKNFQNSIILTKTHVLTFQQDCNSDFFRPLKERIISKHGNTRKMGNDFLLYLLMDYAIDNYYKILEGLEDLVDDLEDKIIDAPAQQDVTSLQLIKRELI